MTALDAAAVTSLGPVREALLAQAHHGADAELSTARHEADALVADAEREARGVVARAREEGDADAAVALAGEQARARRRARAVVLAAQRSAYDTLRESVRERAGALAEGPQWPQLRAELERRARAALDADDAVVQDVPAGVALTSGSRQVLITLPALAQDALDALGPEVQQLWAP
jgi:vacuolar-type H+-ATPase subunit H